MIDPKTMCTSKPMRRNAHISWIKYVILKLRSKRLEYSPIWQLAYDIKIFKKV